jgi:hypothetical protein
MNIVIYTVLTGGYDSLRQPLIVDDRFTYICFTDQVTDQSIGIWKIRSIPFKINDKQRLSRYPKLKPHEVLGEFDFSVYMDANLVIAGSEFYENIMTLIGNNITLAGVKNGWRDCLYDEGFRCVISRLDSASKILKEMRYIKSEGFPRNYGMYEANIIFRNHHDKLVKSQSNMWWDMVISNAKRDQLCFSYTLWKHNINWCYIFPDESNTHNNPSIIFHEHPHKINSSKSFNIKSLLKWTKPILYFTYNIYISINTKR